MSKKISVIIPIYNVELYLKQCLESIVNQTYKNLEIICIDDGSTDNSGVICDSFAKIDSRIFVKHQVNKGKSCACNWGLEYCSGDYISIIDSDDWLESEMYSKLIDFIKIQPSVDMVICGYSFDYEKEKKVIKNTKLVPEGTAIDIRHFLKYIYERDMYRGVASYLPTRIFKKKCIKYPGGSMRFKFPENINVGEDVIFSGLLYMQVQNVVYISDAFYHYRQRQTSVMHDYEARLSKLGLCVAYEFLVNLFTENNIDNHIIELVKRFGVYHASLLLQIAIEKNNKEKMIKLTKYIKKYIDAYVNTNNHHPERIDEVYKLLEKTGW